MVLSGAIVYRAMHGSKSDALYLGTAQSFLPSLLLSKLLVDILVLRGR